MKPAEALAKRIIEGVEVGERMIYREDQSVRTHDFDLHRTAGTVAAVEVTSITDGAVRTTFAAIDRYGRIPRRLCTKDWRIHPAADANIKRLAEKGDAYLADIEATEWSDSSARCMHRRRHKWPRSGTTCASRAVECCRGKSQRLSSPFR